MAAKPQFRVLTLDEMQTADQNEESLPVTPLFQTRAKLSSAISGSDKAGRTFAAKSDGTPLKKMISQKALLSRQPISSGLNLRASTKNASASAANIKPTTAEAYDMNMCKRHLEREHPSLEDQQKSKETADSETFNPAADIILEKIVTSQWTGKTLGPDSNNAHSVHRDIANSHCRALQTADHSNRKQPETDSKAPSGSNDLGAEEAAIQADVLPILAKLGKTNCLIVNPKQRGNPVLNFVRNIPWEFGNIVPDYVMGQSNCALYLSLRYHQLHPEYIHLRLKLLGRSYELRVLLVQVDIKDPHHILKELAKICILADCTLMLAFSIEEAGRYLETYKVYEHKPVDAIMQQTDSSFSAQLTDFLTRVKSVNKTDCSTLLTSFRSLQGVMKASFEDLSMCPGFGPQKAKRLHDVFREPFLVSKKQKSSAHV